MAEVVFKRATRIYSSLDRPAVNALDLVVADGEFLVLVGPSGCGKSTTLRMLAGLEPIDSGSVWIGDRDVTFMPSKDRDIAMVFQSYALYPHMTVAENIGFHLKIKKIPKDERCSPCARGREDPRPRVAARPEAGEAVRWTASARCHGASDRSRTAGVPDG